MRIQAAVLTSALLVTLGCKKNPAEGVPKATATEPAEPAKAAVNAAPAAATVSYPITAANSAIEFVGAKVTGSHDGKFREFGGAMQVGDADPTKSSVTLNIDMGSVAVQPAQLQEHLKSPDFFDVKAHPTATFASTLIKAGQGPDQYLVSGNLTLRGITKAISFPATVKLGAGKVAVQAEFSLNRKDFGIQYAGAADDLIKDNVLIRLKVSSAAQGS